MVGVVSLSQVTLNVIPHPSSLNLILKYSRVLDNEWNKSGSAILDNISFSGIMPFVLLRRKLAVGESKRMTWSEWVRAILPSTAISIISRMAALKFPSYFSSRGFILSTYFFSIEICFRTTIPHLLIFSWVWQIKTTHKPPILLLMDYCIYLLIFLILSNIINNT